MQYDFVVNLGVWSTSRKGPTNWNRTWHPFRLFNAPNGVAQQQLRQQLIESQLGDSTSEVWDDTVWYLKRSCKPWWMAVRKAVACNSHLYPVHGYTMLYMLYSYTITPVVVSTANVFWIIEVGHELDGSLVV